MKVSVILPAYNEEASIKDIIAKLYEILGFDIEVIVVNDCSSDATAIVAKEAGASVVSNPYNMGNGASVKRGIRHARNEIVVLMDADGQHLPEEIPQLLKGMDTYDMVIGQRGASSHVWFRRFANTLYNRLATYVTGIPIKDLTSGFRAIRKEKAMKFLYLLPNTFSYPSTLTLSFIKASYPVAFLPVRVTTRKKGKSKINLFADGTRFFVIILKICVFFSPLKIFAPISIFLFLLGMLYYGYTFINFHRFTNMSALLFTTSIILFMLGLVSEQVAHLRMEKTED